MKTQVLGLGNAVLCDDSAGVKVIEALQRQAPGPEITLTMGGTGGLALVDMIEDGDRLVIVDAIRTGAPPGTIHQLTLADLESAMPFHMVSSHGPNLMEILQLRQALLDSPPPHEVIIYAIEAADTVTLSESCTAEVAAAVTRVTNRIIEMVSGRTSVRHSSGV